MALSGVAGATVKVAAICGSFWKGSYNRGLIRSAIELSKGAVEGVEIEDVDIASLPMLNTDLEKQGTFPVEVEVLRRKILEANSILFASPEYNFSVTGKPSWQFWFESSAMDWGSRPPNVWGGKAAGIVSAGGLLGGARGQFHLRQIGIFIDLHFLNKHEFFLNAFEPPPKFNPLNGDLIDEDAKLRLKQMLLSLKAFTLQLHHNN